MNFGPILTDVIKERSLMLQGICQKKSCFQERSCIPYWNGPVQDPGSSKLVFLKREKKGCSAVVDHVRHGWNV